MTVEIKKLVLACNKSMRKIIQLDDLLESLLVYSIVDKDEFEKINEEFLNEVENCYGEDFIKKFFDICNSANYIENL